ncbi:MAG: PilX N-terminal domain-containing pilus assembly protein [Pseudomonadota bacterium]
MNKLFLYKSQEGAVLVTSLIILMLLTIIALSSMQSTVLQEKMTSAVSDGQLALEAAESALIDAEQFVRTLTDINGFISANPEDGLYNTGTAPDPFSTSDNPWGTARIGKSIEGIIEPPKYYIEYLGEVRQETSNLTICGYDCNQLEGDVLAFRIYALGKGKTSNSKRILTSFYAKQF